MIYPIFHISSSRQFSLTRLLADIIDEKIFGEMRNPRLCFVSMTQSSLRRYFGNFFIENRSRLSFWMTQQYLRHLSVELSIEMPLGVLFSDRFDILRKMKATGCFSNVTKVDGPVIFLKISRITKKNVDSLSIVISRSPWADRIGFIQQKLNRKTMRIISNFQRMQNFELITTNFCLLIIFFHVWEWNI